jgi:hypothetical protein
MWVEELHIENIRCFESETLKFSRIKNQPIRWITFLSENGGGKSTALQALGLLLAGPEGAQKLVPRPLGWLRDELKQGRISTRIHQGKNDPGKHGSEKVRNAFGYSYSISGTERLTINNKLYTEPSIVPAGHPVLTWLRANAFPSKGEGWFAVGYGAFRRLTRSSQVIVPSLEPLARFTNFTTQFDEAEPLSVFERWMVYLDYRILKNNDPQATKQKEMGINAIDKLLPNGARFNSVSAEGRILFRIGERLVPTIGLSDGYRSILALAGDLVWRMILAFPKSDNPLHEEGVVLIDELDIHLHPSWQRDIAGFLKEQFPKIQFFVATHSPFVAAGAGTDAMTYRFINEGGKTKAEEVENVAFMSVEHILQSDAFGLVSTFSPETQKKLDKYEELNRKGPRRSQSENTEYQNLLEFMKKARPYDGPPEPGSLDERIDHYLAETRK